jgi:hypothetical protein
VKTVGIDTDPAHSRPGLHDHRQRRPMAAPNPRRKAFRTTDMARKD